MMRMPSKGRVMFTLLSAPVRAVVVLRRWRNTLRYSALRSAFGRDAAGRKSAAYSAAFFRAIRNAALMIPSDRLRDTPGSGGACQQGFRRYSRRNRCDPMEGADAVPIVCRRAGRDPGPLALRRRAGARG